MAKKCPSCHKVNSTNNTYCSACGYYLGNVKDDTSAYSGIKQRKTGVERDAYFENKRTEDDYKKKGYCEIAARLARASLPEEDVQMLFNKGILSRDLNYIFDIKIKNCVNYMDGTLGKRAKDAGVKFAIHLSQDAVLLFTEDFLVVIQMKASSYSTAYGKSDFTFEPTRLSPLVIPYAKIDRVEVKSQNFSGAWGDKTVTKTGNVVTGAVVGGALGGATGAVIGAAAASRPRTETVIRAGSYDDDIFYFTLSGSNFIIFEERLFNISNKDDKVDANYRWTWALNASITGKYCVLGSASPEYIYKIYNEILHNIVDKPNRFKNQDKITEILTTKYECKVDIPKYATTREFFNIIYKEPKIFEINDVSEYLESVKKVLEKMDSELDQQEEKVAGMKAELAGLKFWQYNRKKELEWQMEIEERVLKDKKLQVCPDTSLKLLELLCQDEVESYE
jgi:hypothetical protein